MRLAGGVVVFGPFKQEPGKREQHHQAKELFHHCVVSDRAGCWKPR